jgi:phosphoribosyl-dephospho-CoA transferase
MLEHAQNQALRLTTGAAKTTPIHTMTFMTGNKSIKELIKQRAVLLYKKLLKISGDEYWKIYENKPRNLKTRMDLYEK